MTNFVTDEVLIRAALEHEAGVLSELAKRSKAHWGYSARFMDACNDELTYSRHDIANHAMSFVVAVSEQRVAGFYALRQLTPGRHELEALFVEPEFMGKGIGGRLLKHATRAVGRCGGGSILIHSDPNATHFYEAAGASVVGSVKSGSIPGRDLPLLELRVDPQK